MNHLVFRKKKRHGTFNPEVGHSWRIFHRKRHLLGLQYDSIFTEMAVVGRLTVRGARIVVPNSMREKVVRLAHERRQGITKTKEYLSTRVWFPGLDKMVEAHPTLPPMSNSHCVTGVEPLRTMHLLREPWRDVAVDFWYPFA